MTLHVYSKPSCVQCTATYRHADKVGADYEIHDLTAPESADMLEMFKAEGLFQAPVVVAGEVTWSGFRPDLIDQHAKMVPAQAA